MATTQATPTAADSGSSASDVFRAGRQQAEVQEVPVERVDTVIRAMLGGILDIIRQHEVTYPEFQAGVCQGNCHLSSCTL